MIVCRIPERVDAVCFDIDNTLYRNSAYTESQTRLLKERLGREKGWDSGKVERELEKVKAVTQKEESHGNWFRMLGIPISMSVKWREELLQPGDYLEPDTRLSGCLSCLEGLTLCALTNNPVKTGKKTLEILGVSSFFSFIVGLDTTGFSKPGVEPFLEVEKRLNLPRESILMVGDRHDVDLSVPLERGWGGLLVENMEDVYMLHALLGKPGLNQTS